MTKYGILSNPHYPETGQLAVELHAVLEQRGIQTWCSTAEREEKEARFPPDLDLLITQSEFPGHRGGGTAAASGSKGVTRATFPDFDPNRFPVEHFQELDVGAVDEEGMVFNQRSKLFGGF